jgi:hypothetical protein
MTIRVARQVKTLAVRLELSTEDEKRVLTSLALAVKAARLAGVAMHVVGENGEPTAAEDFVEAWERAIGAIGGEEEPHIIVRSYETGRQLPGKPSPVLVSAVWEATVKGQLFDGNAKTAVSAYEKGGVWHFVSNADQRKCLEAGVDVVPVYLERLARRKIGGGRPSDFCEHCGSKMFNGTCADCGGPKQDA